ncbi:MAG: hypothetical protein L3K26_18910, partial [Candidatus Hydrogenedentes bacterium]|nr:hypothetical protein [Candidatus Hydrogenedentota bacterium]
MKHLLFLCVFVLSIVGCAKSSPPEVGRPVAARIDGVPIYQDEFEAYFSRLRVHSQKGEPAVVGAEVHHRVALADLIEQRILL